jgi:FkbM family methyltransferase
MSVASVLRGVGNKVYKHGFPIYRPLYAAYKAYADGVDAGANIGIYSRFLSRYVGPSGTVHAFEPSPENFQRLRAATRQFPNVKPIQAAVGERSGETKLYISDKLNVDHRTYEADGNSRRAVSTEMVALDDYFKPGERVDLIKMDIQGYELHALRGANRVLVDNPDIQLLLEFWPYGLKQAGARWVDLLATLKEKGMNIRQVSASGLVPFDPSAASESADWYVNLFASPG